MPSIPLQDQRWFRIYDCHLDGQGVLRTFSANILDDQGRDNPRHYLLKRHEADTRSWLAKLEPEKHKLPASLGSAAGAILGYLGGGKLGAGIVGAAAGMGTLVVINRFFEDHIGHDAEEGYYDAGTGRLMPLLKKIYYQNDIAP